MQTHEEWLSINYEINYEPLINEKWKHRIKNKFYLCKFTLKSFSYNTFVMSNYVSEDRTYKYSKFLSVKGLAYRGSRVSWSYKLYSTRANLNNNTIMISMKYFPFCKQHAVLLSIFNNTVHAGISTAMSLLGDFLM